MSKRSGEHGAGIVAAAVALLLSAPNAALADKKMPAVQPEPGSALVYVYRPAASILAMSKATFSLDEQAFVDLPWGGCAFIQVTPGEHMLAMRWTGAFAPKPGRHEFHGLGEKLMPPGLRTEEGPPESPPDPTLRLPAHFAAGQAYLYQLDVRELDKTTFILLPQHQSDDWPVASVGPVSDPPMLRSASINRNGEIDVDWRVVPIDPASGLPTMRECRYVPAKYAPPQGR
ncbi:MAG: hypothetical protein JSR45_08760 [Proteobacteria bacterium]|nr:hypothetical protein [Pseudomonadota bacterium]